jgi:hypothetical protein
MFLRTLTTGTGISLTVFSFSLMINAPSRKLTFPIVSEDVIYGFRPCLFLLIIDSLIIVVPWRFLDSCSKF